MSISVIFDIAMLSIAIETRHRCRAIHLDSVRVKERANGQIIWCGTVEVFALFNHPEARRCYAWIEDTTDSEQEFVMMLQKGLVISPETAVKEWLSSHQVKLESVAVENSQHQGRPQLTASSVS